MGIPEIEEVFSKSGIHLKEDIPWEEPVGTGKTNVINEIKKNLRLIMGDHVGLVRCEKGLSEAKERINELREFLVGYTPESYQELLAWQEIKLMLLTSSLIADAAWKRKESIGAHYRADL